MREKVQGTTKNCITCGEKFVNETVHRRWNCPNCMRKKAEIIAHRNERLFGKKKDS